MQHFEGLANLPLACMQDVVRSICVTVAYRAPDFGIGGLIFELVHAEAANWDASLTGLRALLTVLLDAPRRSAISSTEFSPSLVVRLYKPLCAIGKFALQW